MVDGYTSYDFLNKEERAKTLESVYALKDHWLHYGKGVFEDVPFYVLGTANYQEVEDGDITGYTKMYQEKNPVLKENFSWLYDRTKIFLEDIYKAPFDFYDNCGLPGFNIYLDDDFFEIAFATRHVDRQYLDIDWKGKEIDESKTLSFTCYLKLPANGGGMNVWNVKYDDVKDIEDPEERENVFDTRGYEFIKQLNNNIENIFNYNKNLNKNTTDLRTILNTTSDNKISKELAKFMNVKESDYVHEIDVLKKIYNHVIKTDLYNHENARYFRTDELLETILEPLEQDEKEKGYNYFNVQKYFMKNYL